MCKSIKWSIGKDQDGKFVVMKSKGAYKTATLYMVEDRTYTTPYQSEAQELADKLNKENK